MQTKSVRRRPAENHQAQEKPHAVKTHIHLTMGVKLFAVVGRQRPTQNNPNPKIYRMKVFAENDTRAKSLFWKHLGVLDRVKSASGQILAVHKIFDPDPVRVKNFGFWIKYRSRSGMHNQYREYRDVTLNRAAQKMFDDMAGRHKARRENIHVLSCKEIGDHEVRRPRIRQFLAPKLKFRNPNKVARAPTRRAFRVFTKKKITTRMY